LVKYSVLEQNARSFYAPIEKTLKKNKNKSKKKNHEMPPIATAFPGYGKRAFWLFHCFGAIAETFEGVHRPFNNVDIDNILLEM
jgi:hypothetical protein